MQVENIIETIKTIYGIKEAEIAIVAGSGLSNALPKLEDIIEVPYMDIGMPKSKVQGHSGKFIFGNYNGKKVVYMSRLHFYESGDIKNVRLPFEIIAKLGVKKIILLTSSGGINSNLNVGDIVLIQDQINMTGTNPLVGIEKMEFTDMSNCYDLTWRENTEKVASQLNVPLKKGIFVQMSGPSYETKAEINMLKNIGCDVVSMSTAFDCIICNYLGIKVIGFAIVVNTFSGKDEKLTHEEVLENAKKASDNLKLILQKIM